MTRFSGLGLRLEKREDSSFYGEIPSTTRYILPFDQDYTMKRYEILIVGALFGGMCVQAMGCDTRDTVEPTIVVDAPAAAERMPDRAADPIDEEALDERLMNQESDSVDVIASPEDSASAEMQPPVPSTRALADEAVRRAITTEEGQKMLAEEFGSGTVSQAIPNGAANDVDSSLAHDAMGRPMAPTSRTSAMQNSANAAYGVAPGAVVPSTRGQAMAQQPQQVNRRVMNTQQAYQTPSPYAAQRQGAAQRQANTFAGQNQSNRAQQNQFNQAQQNQFNQAQQNLNQVNGAQQNGAMELGDPFVDISDVEITPTGVRASRTSRVPNDRVSFSPNPDDPGDLTYESGRVPSYTPGPNNVPGNMAYESGTPISPGLAPSAPAPAATAPISPTSSPVIP